MPLPALIVPLLMSVAAAQGSPITVRGYPWAPFISPMGEPFRSTSEAPIARWFGRADRDRDGMLTADEMQLDADHFFARLDSNRDGQIDPDEIRTYEWEVAPEIQVNSDWRRRRGQAAPEPKPAPDDLSGYGPRRRGHDEHDGYQINGLQGAARYGLLNIPQPVASADADFNRAITRQEFRQAASNRFRLLDGNGQGRITLPELEARLPLRPKGKRVRPRKDERDARIGLPVPEGN
jgi:Ca2+-binding EF-hand superfamily protein